MTDIAQTPKQRRRHSSTTGHLFAIALLGGLLALAGSVAALVLWPRWPVAIAPDAPSLPIAVGGVLFNIPPAAIRVPVQRSPGTRDRLDLAFLWPSLQPPAAKPLPAGKPVATDEPPPIDRVFVTIVEQTVALSPAERVKTIYPRYLADTQYDGPDGLKIISFRDGTPYQGEDIYFDQTGPTNFLVRCNRPGVAMTPGMCLSERRIGGADVTVRFPSEWLKDWRSVSAGIDKLVASFKASGG
jgi:hypothetical protein